MLIQVCDPACAERVCPEADLDLAFVVPGFIDVHAHWEGFSDPYPAKSWEMETFLAYGVTTLHK
jgi:N-acyl-D-aspartate/D-glutamate deacylase